MSRNVIFMLLVTAVLVIGLAGCMPTVDTNVALPSSEAEIAAAAANPTAAGEVGDQDSGPLATVEQAAMSSGYPGSDAVAGSDAAGQMENSVMETPGEDNSGETAAFDNPYPAASGIVNPDPDASGIVNPDPDASGIDNPDLDASDIGNSEPDATGFIDQDNAVDSGIENTPDGAPGSTDGGPATGGETGSEGAFPPPEMELNPETWLVYTNHPYGFQVSYPMEYAIRQPGVQVSATGPTPLATVEIIDPVLAQGELATLQPPELAIRIYDNNGRTPLDAWLRDAGKMNPDLGLVGEPYNSLAGAGVQICLATFVAPRCSVFFAHEGAVYELTPLGLVGEAMLNTFAFTS